MLDAGTIIGNGMRQQQAINERVRALAEMQRGMQNTNVPAREPTAIEMLAKLTGDVRHLAGRLAEIEGLAAEVCTVLGVDASEPADDPEKAASEPQSIIAQLSESVTAAHIHTGRLERRLRRIANL